MAKSVGAFARDMKGFPDALHQAATDAVAASALMVTKEARKRIADATGGDSRISNMGRRGAKVGARYDVRQGKNPSAIVKATGPLQIIERDTKPHRVPRERKSKRGKKRLVLTPWGPRAFINHPGTKGKHPFEKAVAEKAPKVPKVFQEKVAGAMRKQFGGS